MPLLFRQRNACFVAVFLCSQYRKVWFVSMFRFFCVGDSYLILHGRCGQLWDTVFACLLPFFLLCRMCGDIFEYFTAT